MGYDGGHQGIQSIQSWHFSSAFMLGWNALGARHFIAGKPRHVEGQGLRFGEFFTPARPRYAGSSGEPLKAADPPPRAERLGASCRGT
jgi:hypothetical protein